MHDSKRNGCGYGMNMEVMLAWRNVCELPQDALLLEFTKLPAHTRKVNM